MSVEAAKLYIVEFIRSVGLNPAEQQASDNPNRYELVYKDALVWIEAFAPTQDTGGLGYFSVMCPLFKIPDRRREEFALDCLRINDDLVSCAICLRNNYVVISYLRDTHDLDQSEVDACIRRVSSYGADYRGKLSFKYDGCWTNNDGGGGAPGPA